MATAYLAVSHGVQGFRRFFVVKRLREDVAQTPHVVSQFINEARLGASLVHSNIVPIVDVGRLGNEYFVAQEYILGRDLNFLIHRSRQETGGGLPLNAVFHLAQEILNALAYAHSQTDSSWHPLNIVHRDLSPMNVLLSGRGEVKLLDFGIARFTQREGSIPDVGLVKGNVLFMSPEQARGLPIDARSDLFSLGLTLYHSLTGETLYPQNGSDYDLLVRAARGPGPVEQARISELAAPAAELLSKALQVDPAKRFESADEFLFALPEVALAGGSAALLEAVQHLLGADLASEEARLAALDLPAESTAPSASEPPGDPGKAPVQFVAPNVELHR
jgi:serine/threonine protein kinase